MVDLVGLALGHLSRLEAGRYFPSLDSLERIAWVGNAPLVEFFQFPNQETPVSLCAFLAKFAKQANKSATSAGREGDKAPRLERALTGL